jgi:protein-S-isoprenylcysteine O-methyltransferase Ste14
MAVGVVLAIDSLALWVLLPLTVAYLELLVGPWEERQLARDFGAAYKSYVRQVRKWLPHLSAKFSAQQLDDSGRQICNP